MDNETLFYIFGIGLAVSAVVVSFLGLKLKDFPGKAFPVVILWFAIFVGGATTFAVLHAKDEEKAKAAETEPAGKKYEEDAEDVQGGEAEAQEEGEATEPDTEGKAPPKKVHASAGSTLKLAADTSALAFDTTELSAEAGEVTIDFDNPSAIGHDVAIEKDGKEIAATEVITESSAEVNADLEPGTYTFLCTVPGHAEAGMEGTLTVK
jgi:plastocyanin